jgi:MFS family permease
MRSTGAAGGQLAFVRSFTGYQWLVFFVVWAGWSLDATDFGLFSLVLRPALTELLGGQPSIADIGRVGGILSTVGLLGWSLGGFLFGIIADYICRVRTLALSILIYSVFTGLQGLAQSPLDLGIYRFFAGVGTGAEIIVGIPLVAEAFAEANRAKVLGVMMTGGAMGSIIGGQVYALIGGYGWRYVFFAGIAPALLLLLIRRNMIEPERFMAVRERRERWPPAAPQLPKTGSSCASSRCNCSTDSCASAHWSACFSRWAHCWRSGRPSSGCRRSTA